MKDERNYIDLLPKTREEKLNHLISILKNVEKHFPQEMFTMTQWIDAKIMEFPPNSFTSDDINHLNDIGFAADVLGWACLDPKFNNLNLSYDKISAKPQFFCYGDQKCYQDYEAASEFFELTSPETYFIFDPDQYDYDFLHPEFKNVITHKKVGIVDMFLEYNGNYGDDIVNLITPSMVISHIEYILT